MSSYIHFTEEEKEQARNTDLAALLKRRGETLKRAGSEYEWQSDSGKVTIRVGLWYHQYEREGGDAIGFVQRYGNLTFAEAVASLLSEQGIVITGQQGRERQKQKKPFALPKASADMRRMYAYLLKERFLDREIVNAFVKENLLYEESEYHNAVFVGRRMEQAGLERSMAKKGCSPDNSACEGLFGRLKNEMFYNRDWTGVSIQESIDILNECLIWYNEKRIKISLGNMSPREYRQSLGLAA